MSIHPTAIIHPEAVLGEGTRVGPFTVIDGPVRVGKNCDIQSHVVLRGHLHLGDNCQVFPGAVLGGEPQHLKYKGEPTLVEIGEGSILRECVTVHRGTEFGHGKTVIGKRALIMAYTHVAHDCILGDDVIIANSVQLAGHVEVGSFCTIGGQSAVAQFCRIGDHCYVGGGSILRKDLPPFLLGKGNDFEIQGINLVGLSRKGFSSETLQQLKQLYKIFYLQSLTTPRALEKIITDLGQNDHTNAFCNFVQTSRLGVIR